MADYINREALLKDIDETVVFTVRKGTPLPTAEMRGSNKVIDRIKSAPTADVVEVVRYEGHPDPVGEPGTPGRCEFKCTSCYSKELHAFAERLKECLPPWLHIYVDTVGKEIGGECQK